jgi:predicted nucleotidyltransferase
MINSYIKQKIKDYFLINNNAKHRVRELERILKLPLPSIIRYCKELKNEGILTNIKIGDVVFYTANKTNYSYMIEKKLFNIKQIYYSGIIEYLKLELSNPPIILFGSFSKGEDIEESDIDLYIETSSNKKLNLDKFEKILYKKIQLFRHKNLNVISNSHLANNIINGIILNNYVEVFK